MRRQPYYDVTDKNNSGSF